jgi:hypothetical protein
LYNRSLVISDGGESQRAASAVSRLLRLYEKKRGDRRTGSTKLGSAGEALFFSVFLLMGVAGFTIMLMTIVWPELHANRHFSETKCKVVSRTISEQRSEDKMSYRPDVAVEFEVTGKEYAATTYDVARAYLSSREKAQEVLDQFEEGKEYPCWYDPLNPENVVLVRGYSGWTYLLLLIPVSFVAIGGGGLIYTLWHWGTSAERRASLAQRAANIDLLNDATAEQGSFPLIPSDVDWRSSPGTKLAYRLPIGSAPGWQLFALFAVCLVWNGITSVFVVVAIRSHLQGKPEWLLTVFITPFVLIGIGIIYALVRQILITTGVGPTRVEISQHPLRPGDECELYLSQEGRLTMNSLEVLLVCDEQATYRQGTDTRTDHRRVFKQSVYRREGFEIDQAVPFEHQWSIRVPEGVMHSFKSTHNEVKWKLLVKGDVAGWPDFEREYPVIVFPNHQEAKS